MVAASTIQAIRYRYYISTENENDLGGFVITVNTARNTRKEVELRCNEDSNLSMNSARTFSKLAKKKRDNLLKTSQAQV